jgi:hypothetical protein
MNDEELSQRVREAYSKQYASWTNLRVTEIVRDVFGGNLAVVNAIDASGEETGGEICLVSAEGRVTIFSTTEEIARHLESRANQPWYRAIASRALVSTVLALVLLTAIVVLAFYPNPTNPGVVQTLSTAFGAVIGFYFGTIKPQT